MFRTILPVTALALGFGAAPVSAQSTPNPVNPPETATAERPLEQSRRVLIGRPASPGPSDAAAERAGPAKAASASGAARAADAATGDKPGSRR